jgi:hypothetical protein
LNGGEHQDPDDVRVGETHVNAPEGFERGVARDVDATDAGPDSEFDTGVRTDDRTEQRDDAADEPLPSSADSADSTRTRGNERAR